MSDWIGVDFDRTLAEYHDWETHGEHPGPPVPKMLARVKRWLKEGKSVRIFTARIAIKSDYEKWQQEQIIRAWCRQHIGAELPITNMKDMHMVALWDDLAVSVEPNTGTIIARFEEPR